MICSSGHHSVSHWKQSNSWDYSPVDDHCPGCQNLMPDTNNSVSQDVSHKAITKENTLYTQLHIDNISFYLQATWHPWEVQTDWSVERVPVCPEATASCLLSFAGTKRRGQIIYYSLCLAIQQLTTDSETLGLFCHSWLSHTVRKWTIK